MIISTVRTLRFLKSDTILIPPQGYELYHITDSIYYKNIKDTHEKEMSLVTSFFKYFNVKIIKRIVITDKLVDNSNVMSDLDVSDTHEEETSEERAAETSSGKKTYARVVVAKNVSTSIQKKLYKMRAIGRLGGVGLISTVTQNSTRNTTLFDISSVMYKISQRLATFNNKTNDLLSIVSKMTRTKITTKILIISTPKECILQTSFLRCLQRDYLKMRNSHSINEFKYVIINLVDDNNNIVKSLCINMENASAMFNRAVSMIMSYAKSLNMKVDDEEIDEVATKIIQKNLSRTKTDAQTKEELINNHEIKDAIKTSIKLHADVISSSSDTEKSKILDHIFTSTVKDASQKLLPVHDEPDKEEKVDHSIDSMSSEDDLPEIDDTHNLKPSDDIDTKITKKVILSKTSTQQQEHKKIEKVSKQIEAVSKLYVTPKKMPPKLTHTDSLSNFNNRLKYISNLFNIHQTSSEIIQTFLDIYNDIYWKSLGYDVKVVDVVRKVTNNTIKPSAVSEFTIRVRYGKKSDEFKINIPDFSDDGISWLNGVPRVLLNQLYMSPVVSTKQNEVMLRTSYSSLTVRLITKNKITYYDAIAFGQNIPALLIMLAHSDSLEKTLADCDMKYFAIVSDKEVNDYSNEYLKLQFAKNAYLVVQLSKIYKYQTYILSTFRMITKLYDVTQVTFNDKKQKDFWKNVIAHHYSTKMVINIEQMNTMFLDPVTKIVLKQNSLPIDMYHLILYMIIASMDISVTEVNDINSRRVRNYEIISILLFKNINSVLLAHSSKLKKDIKIHQDAIINDLLLGQSSSQFNIVHQPYNPLSYASLKTAVTYKGLDGIENASKELRNVHPSMKCAVDYNDTSENTSVGEVQYITVNARTTSLLGKLQGDSKDCKIHSITTSMLPFTKYNDSNRVQMAATQIKQALPLVNSERPLVATGYEPLIAHTTSNMFVLKSDVDGKVTAVDDDTIVIKDEKNKSHVYKLLPQHLINTVSKLTPLVKVNDNVKSGTLIAENKNFFKNGTYAFGSTAKVAYMTYMGYGIEDGVVISESFAEKLQSVHSTTLDESSMAIFNDMNILYVRSELGPVKRGEDLVVVEIPSTKLNQLTDEVRGLTSNAIQEFYSDKIIYRLKSHYDGIIDDIEIYPAKGEYQPELKNMFENFKKKHTYKPDNKTIYRFSNIKGESMSELMSHTRAKDYSSIIYRIVYNSKITLGDKLTNRHGHKGIVSLILPDNEMPRDNEREFDMLINPFGILGRKNFGQLIELHLSELLYKLDKDIKMLYESKKYQEAINLINKVYSQIIEDKDKIQEFKDFMTKEVLDDIIHNGLSLPFDTNNNIDITKIHKIMKSMNIEPLKNVYVPALGTYTRNKVSVGRMYIIKLQQRSEVKTRSRGEGEYDITTLQAVQGRKRGGGVKVGEYDLYSLLSHNLKHTVKEMYSSMSDDHESKYNIINQIVENGSATQKEVTALSTTSNAFLVYMLALHSLDIK